MMKSVKMGLFLALVMLLASAFTAQAATEVQWWHAMGGKLGQKVEEICKKFNASQSEYVVKPVYKGNYTETMTSAIAAFRAKKQPHIVQVFEVGTASMMAAEGAIYPVYKLMADMGEKFDQSAYLQAVIGYYTTPEGNMLSMPFNSSTPVLYYNKTAFKKAGLDPNKPPKTWPELAEAAQKCIDAGASKYGFSVGWQSWVLIENFSAWHNVPIGSKANGFEGIDTRFEINSPLHVKHIQAIAGWQKTGIFKYGGRRSESAPLFINGEAAMYMNSSASRAGILSGVKGNFEVGVSYLPYWPEAKGAPQNSIIGGATLWVLSGHPKQEYKAVAKFLSFLSKPEIQADWHQFTGYVPITNAAFDLTKSQGYYGKNPGADIAIKQLNYKKPTPNSKGLRFGNFVQIRDIFNEEMEAIWAGKKTAKAGLEDMVNRGNALLDKFKKANQ
jgi:sn-glycerol 3-phosphate transport system substrate-binding protein